MSRELFFLLLSTYFEAFHAIDRNASQTLIVIVVQDISLVVLVIVTASGIS
jgi:hypothetical protein